METLVPLIVVLAILALIWRAATNSLTTGGVAKFGKGKKGKDIGPAATYYTEKLVAKAAKSGGKAFWQIVKRPFR